MDDKNLAPFRAWIEDGFAAYAHTVQMEAALQFFAELLAFRRRHEWSDHVQMERQMQRLSAAGVTYVEAFKRVCEFAAYLDATPHAFPNRKAERFALARAVLKLASMGTYRPTSRLLGFLGDWLYEEGCLSAASAFVRKLNKDAAARAALMKQATDWSDVKVTP